MKWWKWLLVTFATLLVTAGAVVAGLVWLVGTERGTAWLAAQADSRAGAALSISGVHGTLWHGFTIDALAVDLPGHELRARDIGVVITPRALLERRVEIEALGAAELSYRHIDLSAEGDADASPAPSVAAGADARPSPRHLPVTVHVHEALVSVVRVIVDQQSWEATDTRFTAHLVGDTLTITGFAAEAEGLQVSGSGEVSLAEALGLTAELAWSGQIEGRDWAGQGLVAGTWPEFHVWHSLALPFEILLEGELSLDAGPAGTMEVSWNDLMLDGYEWVSSPAGTLTVSGAWPSLRFDGAADLLLDGEPVSARLSGTGTPDAITLDEFVASGEPGNVTLTGDLSIESLAWDVTFEIGEFDPSFRFPDWPGRLQAAGRSSGRLIPELAWTLDDLELAGQLRGYPFTAEGGIRHRPDSWELDTLRVQSDENILTLHGRYADQVDLELTAEVEDFSTLWPELRGAVSGELQILGTRNDLQAQGTVVADGLRYREFGADRLVAVSSVDGGAEPSVELALSGQTLTYRTAALSEATLRVSGNSNAHQIELSAHADDWSAEAVASGALSDAHWEGRVDSLVIDQAQLGQWRQQQPAALVLGRDRVRLEPVCLSQDSASLCGNVRLEGADDDHLALSAADVDARLFSPFLPEGFVVEGIYNASLNFTGRGDTLQGELSVLSDFTSFDIAMSGQPVFASSIEDVNVDAVLSENALRLRAGFVGADTGVVNFRLNADDVRAPEPHVDMQMDVLWPDLSFLALLSPDVTDVAGTLSVQLSASGRADAPDVAGSAELSGGALGVPALGLLVSDITASALSSDGSSLDFDASGLIGDRQVSVTGSTELDYRASFPTRLTLRGDSVPAVQLPEVQVYVSPDLTASVRLPEIDVSGTVDVPWARITLQELPAQAVAPSADTVVHGELLSEPVRPLQMRGDLRVRLGEDVRYAGMNLDTQVTGDLRLQYQSGRPLNASGALTMDGTYNAYGQLLDLDRGELIFSGPLNDPALDVRAVRQINDTMVGVQLTGRLQAPDTRIISSPAMSEADALAYMLFGRPMTGSRGEETATLQSAALAMGLQQALPVFQRIGEVIGFDEFSVQATDIDAGALMAGKHLSSNVYLRYTYGLFNGIGGLLLRFRLSDRLSLETRSAEHKSMDLLYTVERD